MRLAQDIQRVLNSCVVVLRQYKPDYFLILDRKHRVIFDKIDSRFDCITVQTLRTTLLASPRILSVRPEVHKVEVSNTHNIKFVIHHTVSKNIVGNIVHIVLIYDCSDQLALYINYPLPTNLPMITDLSFVVSNLAHDIRNALSIIHGFSSLLKSSIQQSKQQEYIKHIHHGVLSIDKILDNIQRYSKPMQLQLELFNLLELVKTVVSAYKAIYNEKNLQWHWRVHTNYDFVIADITFIKLAIQNLIHNAIDAAPCHSNIYITIHRDKHEHLIFSIADEGSGIEDKNKKYIFTPLFTTKTHGSGLGLFQVYNIMKAHSGTVFYERKNNLSLFSIVLPLKP